MSQPRPEGSPRPTRSRPGWRFLGGVLVVLALVAGGCGGGQQAGGPARTTGPDGSSGPSSSTPATATPGAGTPTGADRRLAPFYEQELAWRACGGNQCATLKVPLDYAHPAARSIRLAVLRVPASDKAERLGSIVVNPGGPGGSGVQYAAAGSAQFGSVLTRHYDIVGFDPRGVGKSTPLHCLDTAQLDTLVAFDPDPDTRAERRRFDQLLGGFGRGCLRHSGALTRHMSTVEAARDIDILRAALGEKKLDYLGASYGTFLGATYADLFPTHVDKMVLDGALDPALSNAQLNLQQAHGFEVALRAYVQDCIDQGSCYLGGTVDQGTRKIRAFYDQLERKPLPTGDADRPLTAGLGMIGTWLPLYVKGFWPQLTTAMRAAMDNGDGSSLLQLADLYLSRGSEGYTDNSMEALYAVNCLDHDDYIPTSQVPRHFAQFEKASPTFGRAFAFGLSTCSTWPVRSGHHTTALHAKGAPPILVIGTTRDPATPLSWAKALAEQLDSGVLVTRDGDGHTGFMRGNDCVDTTVNDYFVDDKVPAGSVNC